MTLIVEDGTNVANAESYASVAQADARLAALGYTTWGPLLEAEKEAALRRATNYMTQEFRSRWKGNRTNEDQALDWPRIDVEVEDVAIATNVVPLEVRNANIDLAIKAAAGDLNPDITPRVIQERIGPLEQRFAETGVSRNIFRAVWMALSPYLANYGSSQVIR
jgi:hypothetical protein